MMVVSARLPQNVRLLNRMHQYLAANLKNRSHKILRLWTDHCEYIVAQKCRRGQQMISLYTKIWDDHKLRELFLRFRRQVRPRVLIRPRTHSLHHFVINSYNHPHMTLHDDHKEFSINIRKCFDLQVQRHAKGFVLSTVGLAAFDWDAERITYDLIKIHLDEIEFVRKLQLETIVCQLCQRRYVIDTKVDGIEYCKCTKDVKKSKSTDKMAQMKNAKEWKPYLERKNMVVWRREELPGLYAYKGKSIACVLHRFVMFDV